MCVLGGRAGWVQLQLAELWKLWDSVKWYLLITAAVAALVLLKVLHSFFHLLGIPSGEHFKYIYIYSAESALHD
jgi:hypothetical protein